MFGGDANNLALADTWILEPVAHADVTPTGPGCAGLAGTPTLAPAPGSMPWIGHTFTTEITGISTLFRIPLLVLGFSNPNTPGLLCRADCTLRAQLDLPFALASTNGQATWSAPIPNDPNLLGFNQLYTQVVVFNFATGCFDAMSNGLRLTIGAR